jgi:UDP-2-acetamido-2,6-beta-L-arabino-hexul-4-ose reductase
MLPGMLTDVDVIVHLAGENRPADERAFADVNVGLTAALCEAVRREAARSGRRIPLILASSIQAAGDTAYGRSKREAEQLVEQLAATAGSPVTIFRFPNVFGKWCKPRYNSVVATFCHQLARGLPIEIHDAATRLRLVYIDDVVAALLSALEESPEVGVIRRDVAPEYAITVGELAIQLTRFARGRTELFIDRTGSGLVRALYATYVSYLPPDRFAYALSQHRDARGVFAEMLKTSDCGQLSFFTMGTGVTRGAHYHHSKTEKFLVVKGQARMRFRHLITGETCIITLSGDAPQVVDSVPGWVHDITNIGEEEAVVMLWANEVFDRQRPDTMPCVV